MPYIDHRVNSNLYQEFGTPAALAAFAERLESALAAPVRVVWSGTEQVAVSSHSNWRGEVRTARNYNVEIEDDTFRTRGISIFIRAWRAPGEVDGENPRWYYGDLDIAGVFTEMRGGYENYEHLSVEHYGYTNEVAESNGAVTWAFNIVPEEGSERTLPLAEIHAEGRCIIISPMITNLAVCGEVSFSELHNLILAQRDPSFLSELREKQAAESHATFVRMMEDRGDSAITECRNKCAEWGSAFAKAQETVIQAKANRDSYTRQLAYLLDQSENDELTAELIESEWNGIVGNVNVESFDARTIRNEPHLRVFTKHLWLTRPDNGRKLPLGKFEIDMNFGANKLRIVNQTMRQENRWDHPHIGEGVICAAEYQSAITQLLRDRKLAQMTNMMFAILGTVTIEDAWGGTNIRFWENMDNEMRAQHGWPIWSENEEEHPLRLEEIANEQEDLDNE